MPRSCKPGVDWPKIKERWECGETPSEIARTSDLSRQAITQRADREGWTRKIETPATLKADNVSIATVEAMGRRTDENAALVLAEMLSGAHPPLAARRIGMEPATLLAWMRSDETFGQKCIDAQLAYTREMRGHIEAAAPRDWKAGAYLLERHPVTKEAFKSTEDRGKMGITVVINMPDRDQPITIEGSQP